MRYARQPEGHIAYQVLGEGPPDLIFVPNHFTHLDLMWEDPVLTRFLERLSSFCRLIVYDKIGNGLSDRLKGGAFNEFGHFLDDFEALMKAVGTRRVVLYGHGEGGPTVMLMAATFPEKVPQVILHNTTARRLRAPDYPIGIPEDAFERFLEAGLRDYAQGGTQQLAAPSRVRDPAYRAWIARYIRASMGPSDAMHAIREFITRVDMRRILASIPQPTLVLHNRDDPWIRADNGRYLADHLPNARYVELEGTDHAFYSGDVDAALSHVQEFVTGEKPAMEVDRVLSTILFADIVGSTEKAAELGDRAWKEILESYYGVARREVARHRGKEIDTAGDGYFASFDAPARAVRAACAMRDAVKKLGFSVRAGVHTGECERIGGKLGGIAVHIGARVAAQARADEVVVSGTVKDLVAGSGLKFDARGAHTLKGVPGEWQLYAAS